MSNFVVVGTQWGDEGKGKIVDFLTEKADVVVRAQGGSNAGHTVIYQDTKYILHLIPSGILWQEKLNVIGNGVVIDPQNLAKEIETLRAQGVLIQPKNLRISERAHLTLPCHRALDQAREILRGSSAIGTTGRGIGPTYSSKAQRNGIRCIDLRNKAEFINAVIERTKEANQVLAQANLPSLDPEQSAKEAWEAAQFLLPYLDDTAVFLHQQIKNGAQLLFEGAQGTYLDIDHGSYPFVTSSNTTVGGCATGSGVAPTKLGTVVGVTKAYTTRVGAGPCPTEEEAVSQLLHGMGREYGATTGRARRCGWLDLVLLRYAVMINGCDLLAVTNVDGLDSLAEVKVCTHYLLDGEKRTTPPTTAEELEACVPVFETFPGWQEDTTACRTWEELPEKAKNYLDYIGDFVEAKVGFIGIGPARDQTIIR